MTTWGGWAEVGGDGVSSSSADGDDGVMLGWAAVTQTTMVAMVGIVVVGLALSAMVLGVLIISYKLEWYSHSWNRKRRRYPHCRARNN